jgi:hypothetical protein
MFLWTGYVANFGDNKQKKEMVLFGASYDLSLPSAA